MSLQSGARLGPYLIAGRIGAGGMGEVWKAKDERLGREVAIKVLPAEFAEDAERMRRFEVEARAASALNHPNILTVHDLGQHQGSPYLVMELLEGETLRERMKGAALPARKAVEIALQLARGLAAAHEKGILHRDLKPENIFLSATGHVKILDFGLARMRLPEGLGATLTQGSTVALGTRPGVLLGTVGYMAPEQVKGEPTGPAGDLFALGCVLFEMLAGGRAFQGDSAVAVLHGILSDDPLQDAARLAGLPAGLVKVLERCLEKRPGDRFQSAHDLAFALEAAAAASTTSAPTLPRAGRPGRLLRALGWVLLLGLVGGVSGFLGRRFAPERHPGYEAVTFRRGTVHAARVAADGSSVVYTAGWEGAAARMYLKRADAEDAVPIGPPGAVILSVSKAGELAILMETYLAAPFTRAGTLAVMSAFGDTPRPVENGVAAADWSPASGELALVKDLPDRHRLQFPRGRTLYETKGWLTDLRFSPDGSEIAFLDHPLREDGRSFPVRLEVASGRALWPDAPSRIANCRGLAWTKDGTRVLVGVNRRLTATDRSGRRHLVGRFPRNVVAYQVLGDGRMLLGQETRTVGLIGEDESGQRDLSWLTWSLVMDLSADGRQVLFSEFGVPGDKRAVAALRGFDGSPVVRLGEGFAMGISRDGRWVTADSLGANRLLLLPTGVGEVRELPAHGVQNRTHARFLPDGQRVAFLGYKEGTGTAIFLQDIEGGAPRALGGMAASFGLLCVAPSGARIIASGPDRAPWIFPLDGKATPLPGGKPGDIAVRWSDDEKAVYLVDEGEVPALLRRLELATGRAALVKRLVPADRSGLQSISPVVASADARRVAFSYQRVLSDLYFVDGLLH